jgi:glycosyltransferase involved in cell wall biosynthesis
MVSFVIPAHNEERLIGRTLTALREAAATLTEPHEVIVADDDSTDRTAEVARAHGARVVRVSLRQIGAVRNAGAREARGHYLVFVDADTVVNAAVVAGAVRAMQHGASGGGSAVRFDGPAPLIARAAVRAVVWAFRTFRLAAGCFVFCTREAFDAIGGFDEELFISEEVGLSRALGRHGRFVVLHEPVETSGRKVRAYSIWQIVRVVTAILFGGRRARRTPRGLEMWYDDPRQDPWSHGPGDPAGIALPDGTPPRGRP